MKSKYRIRGLTTESYKELNKHILTHVRRIVGVPQNVFTAFNMELDDVHLKIHKTKNNSTSRYITVTETENIKDLKQEYVDLRRISNLTPVFEDPDYLKIDSFNKKVKRYLTIEFRSGEETEIKTIKNNVNRIRSRGALEITYDLDRNVIRFIDHVRDTKSLRTEEEIELDNYLPADKRSVKRWSSYEIALKKVYDIAFIDYEYILKADIEVIYNRDLLLFIDHSILFNNSVLQETFMRSRGRLNFKSNLTIVKELGNTYSTFLTNQDENYNIPITDDFIPSINDARYKALITIVLPLQDDKRTLGNLKDLAGVFIPDRIKNFMLGNREVLLTTNQGYFILELYEGTALTDQVLTVEEDGTLKANKDLDLTKIYRLTIKKATDLTMLTPEETERVNTLLGDNLNTIAIYINSKPEESHNLTRGHRAWLDRYRRNVKFDPLDPFAIFDTPKDYYTGDIPLVLGDVLPDQWSIVKPAITSEGYDGNWVTFTGNLVGTNYDVVGRYPGSFSKAEWVIATSDKDGTPNLEDPANKVIKLSNTSLNISNLGELVPNKKIAVKLRYISDFETSPLNSPWSEPFTLTVPSIGVEPITISTETKDGKLIITSPIVDAPNAGPLVGAIDKGTAEVIISKGDEEVKRINITDIANGVTEISLIGFKPGEYNIKVIQPITNDWLNAKDITQIDSLVTINIEDEEIPFIVNPEWSILQPTLTSTNYNSNSPSSTLDNFTGIVTSSAYEATHEYPGTLSKVVYRFVTGNKDKEPSFLDNESIVTGEQDGYDINLKEMNILDPGGKVWLQVKHKSDFTKHPLESEWSETFIINVPEMGIEDTEINVELDKTKMNITAPIILRDHPTGYIGEVTLGETRIKINKKGESELIVDKLYDKNSITLDLTPFEEHTDYEIKIVQVINNEWLTNKGLGTIVVTKDYHLDEKPFVINSEWAINKPTLTAPTFGQTGQNAPITGTSLVDPELGEIIPTAVMHNKFYTFNGEIISSPYSVKEGYPGPHTDSVYKIKITTHQDSGDDIEVNETIEGDLGIINLFDKGLIKSNSTYEMTVQHKSSFNKYPLESEVSEVLNINVPHLGFDHITVDKSYRGKNVVFTLNPVMGLSSVKLDSYGTDTTYTLGIKISGDEYTNIPINEENEGILDSDLLEENVPYELLITGKINNTYLESIGADRYSEIDTFTMEERPFVVNDNWKIEKPVMSVNSNNFEEFDGIINISDYSVVENYPGGRDILEVVFVKADTDTPTPTIEEMNSMPDKFGIDNVTGQTINLFQNEHFEVGKRYFVIGRYISQFAKHPLDSGYSDPFVIDIPIPSINLTIGTATEEADRIVLNSDIEYVNFNSTLMGDIKTGTTTYSVTDDNGVDTITILENNKIAIDDIVEDNNYTIHATYVSNNTWLVSKNKQEVSKTKPYLRVFQVNENWGINKPTLTIANTGDTFDGILTVSAYSVIEDYPGIMSRRELEFLILEPDAEVANINFDVPEVKKVNMTDLTYNLFESEHFTLGKKYAARVRYVSDFIKAPKISEWSDTNIFIALNPRIEQPTISVTFDKGYAITASEYDVKDSTLGHTSTTWIINKIVDGVASEEVYRSDKDSRNLRRIVLNELPVGEYEVTVSYHNEKMSSKVTKQRFEVKPPKIGDITVTVEKSVDQLPILRVSKYIPEYTTETLETIKLTMTREDLTRTITLTSDKFTYHKDTGAVIKLTPNLYSYMFKDGKPVQPIEYKVNYVSKSLSSNEAIATYTELPIATFGNIDISDLASETATLFIDNINLNGADKWIKIQESNWSYSEQVGEEPSVEKTLPLAFGSTKTEYPLNVEEIFTVGNKYVFKCQVVTSIGTYDIESLSMTYQPVVGTITTPTMSHTYKNGKLEIAVSEFVSSITSEKHRHTSYKVFRTDDNTLVVEVKPSDPKVALDKIILPDRLLTKTPTEYRIEVRYHSKNLSSEVGSYTFTTIARDLEPIVVNIEKTADQLGKITISPYADKIASDKLEYVEYHIVKGDREITKVRDDSVLDSTEAISKMITIGDVKTWLENTSPSSTNKLEGSVDIIPVLYGKQHRIVGSRVTFTFDFNMDFGRIVIKGIRSKQANFSCKIGSNIPSYMTIEGVDWNVSNGKNPILSKPGITDKDNPNFGKIDNIDNETIYDGKTYFVTYVVKTNIGTYITGKNGEYFFRYDPQPLSGEKDRLDLNFKNSTTKLKRYKGESIANG